MMIDPDIHYSRALRDVFGGYPALRPPRRVTVAEGAGDALVIKRPGDATTPWSAAETPYMVEPMNTLASRLHSGVVFVGPAQSGKTAALGEGWMSHVVTNDPGDMLIIQMTEAKAREYSKQRIDRALEHSPKLKALKSSSARADNTHDKSFRHGMWLRIAWPTVTNVSSTSYRYVFITDYDRIPDDIDGEGDLWGLASARPRTFLSRGMCAAESSPGRPIEDPNWEPATPHEAPPTGGILGLYNRTDRRRWYWRCPDCRDHFEAAPGMSLFHLPSDDELLEMVREIDISAMAKQYNRIVCPACGSLIPFKLRDELNRGGVWVPDGGIVGPDGELMGDPMTSSIAGFWLGGVAASYSPWTQLLTKHLQAMRDYALTGSELGLQTTINTDQGMPYISRHLLAAMRNGKGPQDRGNQALERYVVPEWTRTLVASVDVQGGSNARFVVQVHAVGPHFEQALVNRFAITTSRREGMGEEFAPLDPASYAEDWDILTDELLRTTYRTPTEGREMLIRMAVVDSGGEDGVTDKAYAWYRRVRALRLHHRVRLYKGASTKTAPIVKESMVGGRKPGEKGDVPLYVCNPNLLSDAVDTGLKRATPGPGYIHFPPAKDPVKNPDGWLPKSFFDELTAEVRDPSGVWKQIRKRNESFDLCRMIRAGMLILGLDKIKSWDRVPEWLAPLDQNCDVITVEERRDMKASAEVAPEPKPVVVVPRSRPRRRSATSSYLGA